MSPNYKVRLKNFLFKHSSRKNRKVRLIDDKKELFDVVFDELMMIERAVKKSSLEAISGRRDNGPVCPEEILYYRFTYCSGGFVYLPDWGGFGKADLLYFKSRFEQLLGDLT